MRALVTFLAARLARALVAVWLVSTVVFVVMRLSGDPVPLLLPPDAPRSEFARVARELGTDRPLPVQYAVFLGHVAQGDFGRSIHFREPAMRVALEYLPATAQLGLTAFVFAVLVAVPAGVVSAVRRNTVVDQVAMGVALVGQSAPTFFLGILFILTLSLRAGLFPTSGRGDWTQIFLSAGRFVAQSSWLGRVYGFVGARSRARGRRGAGRGARRARGGARAAAGRGGGGVRRAAADHRRAGAVAADARPRASVAAHAA